MKNIDKYVSYIHVFAIYNYWCLVEFDCIVVIENPHIFVRIKNLFSPKNGRVLLFQLEEDLSSRIYHWLEVNILRGFKGWLRHSHHQWFEGPLMFLIMRSPGVKTWTLQIFVVAHPMIILPIIQIQMLLQWEVVTASYDDMMGRHGVCLWSLEQEPQFLFCKVLKLFLVLVFPRIDTWLWSTGIKYAWLSWCCFSCCFEFKDYNWR